MKIAIYILIGIIWMVVAGVLWARDHLRAFAMRSLAKKLGLTYAGKSLPGAISLYGTPFSRYTSDRITNVMDGQRNGIRVVAFDCEVYEGKESWSRTVVATKSAPNVSSATSSAPDLKVDHSGGWMILYYPREARAKHGLMPIAELESHLSAIKQ